MALVHVFGGEGWLTKQHGRLDGVLAVLDGVNLVSKGGKFVLVEAGALVHSICELCGASLHWLPWHVYHHLVCSALKRRPYLRVASIAARVALGLNLIEHSILFPLNLLFELDQGILSRLLRRETLDRPDRRLFFRSVVLDLPHCLLCNLCTLLPVTCQSLL